MICSANQWIGFYMIETSVMKELNVCKLNINFISIGKKGSPQNLANKNKLASVTIRSWGISKSTNERRWNKRHKQICNLIL